MGPTSIVQPTLMVQRDVEKYMEMHAVVLHNLAYASSMRLALLAALMTPGKATEYVRRFNHSSCSERVLFFIFFSRFSRLSPRVVIYLFRGDDLFQNNDYCGDFY